jgi:signal transduction histidine kinase
MEVILGSLLHRLQPRLSKLGIDVDYRPLKRQQAHHGLSDVQCLHAGRIVQGCLIAAMQHQACDRVILVLRENAQGIFICVYDNGAPLSAEDMQIRLDQETELSQRATALGSSIRFYNGPYGHATALLYSSSRKLVR